MHVVATSYHYVSSPLHFLILFDFLSEISQHVYQCFRYWTFPSVQGPSHCGPLLYQLLHVRMANKGIGAFPYTSERRLENIMPGGGHFNEPHVSRVASWALFFLVVYLRFTPRWRNPHVHQQQQRARLSKPSLPQPDTSRSESSQGRMAWARRATVLYYLARPTYTCLH